MISALTVPSASMDQLSDAALLGRTGERLAVPRSVAADSFVLHSGLELLARAALLPFVEPESRSKARDRVADLGDLFEAFSDPVRPPRPIEYESLDGGAAALIAAIGRGELDDVDAAATWLGRVATPLQLRHLLADALVPSLAAAGHAPIFLHLLPRVAPRGEITGQLLRQLAREVARRPDWRLQWFQHRPDGPAADGDAISAALIGTPRLGDPVSTFIHPLMSRIDSDGAAGAWLGSVTRGRDLGDRPFAVLRVAARSMIAEPTRHAPYGWSHCLTMPQAVLGVADACSDPTVALAVAATYVAGFRTLADGALPAAVDLADPRISLNEAIESGPKVAAAAAWHSSRLDERAVIATLATRAAVHRDAHLVKYTLACLDAAATDRPSRRLFLASAAALAGWWATNDDDQSP